ncbi:ribonuclease M5 [Amphibacillus sediminis]|uniref:ribonuclease M5 n=1 Tax=Amphibacillus sediminis TaxID=360185 RepID=UPI00082EAEB7|nr:ribonuclease M5 [Amphibacillus sediminis]
MRIKEIIVVEGKDDTAKIKQVLDADTIETNGSAIDKTILEQIKHAVEKRGVIIFTDPDFPGQRIRHIISEAVPGCKHAFLTKQEAISKHDRGIGVEHASAAAIKQALARVYQLEEGSPCLIEKQDLLHYGLIGGSQAKQRRQKLTDRLRLGHANGKQLLKRLIMFRITRKQLEEAMLAIIEEEEE